MKKTLVVFAAIVLLLSCSTDLKDADEALRESQENKYSSSSVNLPLASSSSSLPNGATLSSSSGEAEWQFCQIGSVCTPLDAVTCEMVSGIPVQNCPISSSSSKEGDVSTSSSSSQAGDIQQPSSSSGEGQFCQIGSACAVLDATTCEMAGGMPVSNCPISSSSSTEGDISTPSSSSQTGNVQQPSSSSGEGQFCQISSTCSLLAAATCALAGGTSVSQCNLTCEMSASVEASQNAQITPQPVVKCNGNEVSSGIVWTPSNLTPTSTGNQTISATVANCNSATAVCGNVEVQAPSNLVCIMAATQGMVDVPISTPTVTCNGTTVVSSSISWTPSNLTPTTTGNLNVEATAVCNGVIKTTSCGTLNVVPYEETTTVLWEDFEGSTSSWYQIYSGVNYWTAGSATSSTGSKSAYITNNGTANSYNFTTASSANLYSQVTFPVSSANFTLSFDWKSAGEGCTSNSYDYLSVFLVPSTTSISYTAPSTGQIIDNLSGSSSWANRVVTLLASTYSGNSYNLVFRWTNDGSVGCNPPAAIDNIEIVVNR